MERASTSSSAKNQPAALLHWTEWGRGPCTWSRILSSAGASRAWLAAGLRLALRAPARSAAGGRSPRCVLEGKTSCTVRRHHVCGGGSRGPAIPASAGAGVIACGSASKALCRCRRIEADARRSRRMDADARGCAWGRLGASVQRSRCRTRGAALMRPPPMRGFCVHLHTTDPAQPTTGHRPPQTSRSGRHGCTPGHKR